jgi:Raf kinase inhibitor-like YbhB/YbcL family protein
MGMTLASPAFAHMGSIPPAYTCEGRDISPALAWTGAPAPTQSLVLIVDDPDAPDPKAPRITWVHWLVIDLPPRSSGLAEGAGAGALPAGATMGLNDFKRRDYGGPCPPIGRHRYFFKLYALDTRLGALSAPTKPTIEKAMHGHVLAEATLIGTYEKSR